MKHQIWLAVENLQLGSKMVLNFVTLATQPFYLKQVIVSVSLTKQTKGGETRLLFA